MSLSSTVMRYSASSVVMFGKLISAESPVPGISATGRSP